jgi:dTDP-4-amino-4,6-dideoxygalactose transaminase
MEREKFLTFMKSRGIGATFHYIPLHTSPAGRKYGEFRGADRNTTRESERLVRLPLFFDMTDGDVDRVLDAVFQYFRKHP